MLAGLGYVNPKIEHWYKMPDKDAILPLSNDNDVFRVTKYDDRFKLMQLYVVHLVDKPKPLGDNENPKTEETFDPFFCDLDPDVGEPSEVSNVGEHNEVPNVGEPNKVPNVVDQTEIPNDAEHSDGSDDSDFDVDLEDRIEDVEVDMGDFRKYIDENVEWMLARKHKPVYGNIYSDNFYCGQTFANKELITGIVGRLGAENRRQLWLSKNDKVRVWAQCRRVVPTFSNDDGSQFRPNGPSGSTSPSGQILTAVGVDPNNGTYPLAYAVVEAETKDYWTWFLDCLGDDLQLVRNSNFTFITDRQKIVFLTFVGVKEQFLTTMSGIEEEPMYGNIIKAKKAFFLPPKIYPEVVRNLNGVGGTKKRTALLPGDNEILSDDVVWETLPVP
ncbi:transposase, MuDR [Tanacetum coccineum]